MLPKPLLAASFEPLVLAMLARGQTYGYEIIQLVKQFSSGHLQWSDGMLYPVLHRLERQGLIESVWRVSDSGRKRKYYRLHEAGQQALATERKQWMITHDVLTSLWGPEPWLT